jgi:hypothetical protein
MAKHWEDRNYLINSIGPGGSWGHALWFLTILFALIGVISDLANTALGLTSMAWFLLAIICGILSIPFFIGWAVAWYLKSIKK